MRGENFCPLCGKTACRFVHSLCLQCFLKKSKPVEIPESVEFEQCKSCGKAKLFGKMMPSDKAQLESFVEKRVKTVGLVKAAVHVSVKPLEKGKQTATVLVKGIADSVPLSFKKQVLLKPAFVKCDACMRVSSQYHEAIIQLRGKDKKRVKQALAQVTANIEAQHKKDSLAAVTNIIERKTGFDLKVGSKKAASKAVVKVKALFKAETKQSSKLLGMDKRGRIKRRFTFLLRV